jgi:maltooligosyltrehalose trehalohydrolase
MPWGNAINLDGPCSDEVRKFFIQNALYWITDFRFDALRLDAVHAIFDQTAVPFLQELAEAVHRRAQDLNRKIYLIAESSLNDSRLVLPRALGGFELDAQWNDDFHHALHTLLTSERSGYYQDYGTIGDLGKSYREGYVYSGQYSSYRQRRHGSLSRNVPAHRFVVCAQNHDQIEIAFGRTTEPTCLVRKPEIGRRRCASFTLPSLLFMGEEYGESAPFLYFTSHSDPGLIEAVKDGRRQEFCSFESECEIPDPQSKAVFEASKLNRDLKTEQLHRTLFELYKELIWLRKRLPSLAALSKEGMQTRELEHEKVLWVLRKNGEDETSILFNFSDSQITCDLPLSFGVWRKRMDSADKQWLGSGGSIQEAFHSRGMTAVVAHAKAFVLLHRTPSTGNGMGSNG